MLAFVGVNKSEPRWVRIEGRDFTRVPVPRDLEGGAAVPWLSATGRT